MFKFTDSAHMCSSFGKGSLSQINRNSHLLEVKHPLSYEGFRQGLSDCPDTSLVQYVLDSIENGVRLGSLEGTIDADLYHCKNGWAVQGREVELCTIMQEEVAKGHKSGPFRSPPFDQFKCSPVSFVPKHDSGKVQLIHNLSQPFGGRSVNVLISPEEVAVQYQKFEDFIGMVSATGLGAELDKFDLTNAYKLVLVHPDFWHLLGIHMRSGAEHEF